jgi:hypothetical protein
MVDTRSATAPIVPNGRTPRDDSPLTDLKSEVVPRGEPRLEDDEQDLLERLL